MNRKLLYIALFIQGVVLATLFGVGISMFANIIICAFIWRHERNKAIRDSMDRINAIGQPMTKYIAAVHAAKQNRRETNHED